MGRRGGGSRGGGGGSSFSSHSSYGSSSYHSSSYRYRNRNRGTYGRSYRSASPNWHTGNSRFTMVIIMLVSVIGVAGGLIFALGPKETNISVELTDAETRAITVSVFQKEISITAVPEISSHLFASEPPLIVSNEVKREDSIITVRGGSQNYEFDAFYLNKGSRYDVEWNGDLNSRCNFYVVLGNSNFENWADGSGTPEEIKLAPRPSQTAQAHSGTMDSSNDIYFIYENTGSSDASGDHKVTIHPTLHDTSLGKLETCPGGQTCTFPMSLGSKQVVVLESPTVSPVANTVHTAAVKILPNTPVYYGIFASIFAGIVLIVVVVFFICKKKDSIASVIGHGGCCNPLQ